MAVQVKLQFNADVSQAKNAIKDLQSALQNVTKLNTSSLNINKDLVEASRAASELSKHLNAATNFNTKQFNLNEFCSSIEKSGQSFSELIQKLSYGGATGQQAFTQLASAIAQSQVPLKQTSKLVENLGTTLKNTIKWELSSSFIHGLQSGLSNAISYARNLNTSLNDIRIVTGASAEEMAKFAQTANSAARQLSTTTNAYAKASLIFYQQGLSDDEVKKRTDAVVKMANVTKESMQDVSSYMTAVWNNFDDGSESLEHYADVMTALGAATASSTKEIAAGLEKFASIGKTIGLSYEYATSAVATIVDKTRQSADTVGTGLRTIFSRLQGLKLGETLEDGVDLNKYSSALATVGVNILDATGAMKDMDTILDDLASKWSNLGNAQKTALAQTVGGVRQYTTLISLMDNWDSMEKNLSTAENSDGSLQKQADIYAQSWEAASERATAALEGLYNKLLNDKLFVGLTNAFTGLIDAVSGFVDTFGGGLGTLATFGGVLLSVYGAKLPGAFKTLKENMTQFLVDPQKQYKENLAQMKGELENTKSGTNSNAVAGLAAIIAAKEKLLTVNNKMSESERNAAIAGIDGLSQSVAKVAELEAAYRQTTGEIRNFINAAKNISLPNIGNMREAVSNGQIQTGLLTDAHFKGKTNGEKFGAALNAMTKNQAAANIASSMTGSTDGLSNVETAFSMESKEGKIKQLTILVEQLISAADQAQIKLSGVLSDESRSGKTSKEIATELVEAGDQGKNDFMAAAQDAEKVSAGNVEAIQHSFDKIESHMQQAGQSTDAFTHAIIEAREQSNTLTQSIAENAEAVVEMDESIEDANKKMDDIGDSKAGQKIATSLGAATTAVTTLVNAIDAGTEIFNTLSNKSATSGEKIKAVLKGVLIIAGAVFAGITIASQLMAAGIGTAIISIPIVGWIAGIIAALGMLGAAIYTWLSNQKSEEEKLTEANEKLRTSIEATGNAMEKLEGDLQSLSAVMHDTSLTYDEQLSKINEITAAYGIQASALDVLTGNYAGLEAQMKAALLAREGALISNNEGYIEEVLGNADDLLALSRDKQSSRVKQFESLLTNNEYDSFNQGFMQGSTTLEADAYEGLNWVSGEAAFKKRMASASGKGWGNKMTSEQQDRILDVLEQRGFVTRDSAGNIVEHLEKFYDKDGNYTQEFKDLEQWMEDQGYDADDYDEIEDYVSQRQSSAITGGKRLTEALAASEEMGLTEEGKAWQAFLAENSDLGLTWDASTNSVQLTDGALTGAQYSELYKRMNAEGSILAPFTSDSYNFTGQLMSAAEEIGADIAATAQEQIDRANLISSIIGSDDFTFMTDTHTRDYKELLQFTRKDATTGENISLQNTDFETAMEIADYLSGFEEFQEASMQMQAIGQLATSAGQTYSKGNAEKATAYRDAVFSYLQNEIASGAIDVETAMRLNPSGITVTMDGENVKVEIEPSALELAKQEAEKALQIEVRANVDAIYDIASKENLTYEDIQALQESEYFKDNPEDAVRFASQSSARRKLELDQVKQQTYLDEAEANRQIVQSLQDEQARLQTDADSVINQAIADFDVGGEARANLLDMAQDELGIDSDTYSQLAAMDGQTLYNWAKQALDDQRQSVAAYRQAQADILAEWGDTYANIDEAREAYANMDENSDEAKVLKQQISEYEAAGQGLDAATAKLTNYENLLGGVIQAEEELLSVSQRLKIAQGDQAALDWWATYGAEITKASSAAEAFSNAIGKRGSLSADDLAYLDAYDESGNALENYQSMTGAEWDKYALDMATSYYDELYALYDGDVAKQIEVLQAKEQAEKQYYEKLQSMADEAAKIQQQKWDEAKSAADSAMSSAGKLMSGDMSFSGIEELKQNLIDAGVEVTRVTELIEELSNTETDTEQIKTAMVAASEAALAKLGNLSEQQQEYTGLVTNLDVSEVEPGNVEMHGNLGNGEQVTGEVQEAVDAADPTITADANADGVTSDIESAVTNADGTKTITMDDGSTISGDVTAAVFDANGTKIITMSDGSTISGDISTAVLNADGTKIITMDDGSTISGDIVSAITAADGSKVITYADGSTLSGDIASVVTNADGAKVITYADGSTLSGDIASAVVNADGSKSITMNDGSSLQGDIVTAVSNADGSKTVTLTDGSTFTGAISKAVVDATGTKTITYADNSTLSGDIASAVVNADGTKTIVMDGNNSTLSGDIVSAINATDGSIVVTMSDGSETSLPAEVVAALSGNGKVFDVNAYLANPESLQDAISDLNLTAEVDVKLNLAQQALDAMKGTLMTGLSPDELQEVMRYSSMSNDEILAALTEDNRSGWEKFWGTGKDSQIRWSSSDKAALTQMVSNMIDLSPDEIAAQMMDPNSLLNSLLKALNAAVESGDAETADMAMFLLEGLGQGLSAGCSSFNWDAYLTSLGPEVAAAFKAALGIHSPSTLTQALAPYLFEGLAVGIAECDASFTVPALPGVAGAVARAFSEAIKIGADGIDVSALNGIVDEDLLADFTERRQFMDEHSEVDETTGEAEWETIVGDQAWEAALNAEAVRAEKEAQLSASDSSGPHAIAYEGEMMTPAEVGAQARADAAAAGVIDGKTREQIRQEAIDNYMQEYMNVSSEIITDFSMDYFKNKKWLNDDTMSAVQKAAIGGAVEAAMQEMQITEDDLPNLSEEQQAQFVNLVQTNLNESGEKIAFEIDKTWAEIKDIWISGLDAIYQAETELAEKTFSLWESTFKAIAQARLGLMDDKSILESMFGDPDGVSDIIESYLNAGYQMEDIIEILKNPEAQLDFTPFDLENYHKSGPQRFLNTDENGNYTVNTSLADYNANVDKYVTEQLGPHLTDVMGDTLTQDEITRMKTSGSAEELAFIKFLEDQGIIDASGNLLEGAQALTDVLDKYAQSLHLDTQQEVNAVQADAVSTQQTEYYKRANTLQQEGEKLMSQKESDKALLETARQMKLSGESLSTLTADEQARLLALTGASDLSAVSLENLNAATIECANAMLTCAQQVAVAMGMIQSGQADSWTIDPETGQVTVSKGITYGERGEMAIDADTQARVDQVYSDSMASSGYVQTADGGWTKNGEVINTATDTDWQTANATATTAMNSTVVGQNQIQLGEFNAETDGARIEGTGLEAGLGAVTDADVAMLQDYANALDMTTEEFEDYAKALYKNAETGKEWVDLTEDEKRAAREFAVQAGRISNAWVNLTENQEDNIKTLKKGQKGTTAYRKALGSLQKDVKTIFGDAEEVTSDFVEKHLDDIEKMAEGDEEAAERVEKALLDDMLGDLSNEKVEIPVEIDQDGVADGLTTVGELLNNFGDEYADKEIGFELTADESPALQALNSLMATAAAAGIDMSDSIQAGLDAIGWEPQLEYQVMNAEGKMVGTTTAKIQVGDSFETASGEMTTMTEGMYLIPVIKGTKKTGGGASGRKASGGGGGGRGGGGGGGGGGDRRDPRRADKINKKDNIERYHEIDNVIDDLSDAYERLNEEEDRAWGKNRIDAMKAQTNVIKEQIAATEEKIRQAKEWKDQDLSAALAAGWTFDENGNVNNYDEFLSSQVDKYNAAIDDYNNMSAEAQEELDEKYSNMTNKDGEYYSSYEDFLKQTLIDDPKEALEQYEETMELLEDLGMDYDDLLNEWHDNIIGQIQTKLDTTLEVTEAQLGYLEHKLSRIEDDAYSAAEAIGLMGQQMDIAQTQFNAHKSALDDLLKAYSPEGTVWSAEDLMNGNISSEDLVNAGMQSGDIELIQTIMEGMMDASEQMSEQMVNSIEHMANAFEEFNADMDRYISTVEHAQAITSTYRNIIDLTGRTMSGFNSTMLKSINDAIAAQSIAKLEANKTKYETVKTEYDEAKAAYEAAQQSYAEGGIDAAALKAAKDTYQTAQDNMNEAQEAFLSSWEEALQAAADAFQSNMEAAVRDIGEMMSGGLAGGLAELEDAFAKMNERDQNYVDDYEKIYQLTKMTRDLTDKIDSTSNIRAQKELLKYQKELNGLLESDQEMSAYDLDYLQKKLDLKLAEIALDEAQNAKSQVTMRRDSEGNYNYVYTADENAVEKAESDYADRLYEMQKANDEYITGLSENMANLSSQMLSEIAAIDTTIYDTEEKYQAEVQRITDHYTSQMEYYNSEMNKVLGNNKTLYEQDWTNFSKYTGYKLSAEENYVTKWNQTVLSQVTGFETQEEFYENFNEAVFGGDPAHPSGESLIGRLVTAYKTMREQIAAANAAAGVETEDLATALLGNIEAATQEAEAAADDITEAATEIVTQITSIGDAVTNMVNNYSQAMATMEAETDAMLGVLLDFLTAYGEIGDLDIDPGVLAEIEARRRERQENPEGYDTGGYTGAWGSEGRLAYLHQKELVLNAEDTANMLASVGILRQIASVIDLNALASAGGFISLMSSGVAGNQGTLQQEVHIEASFPAVTDKNQIEEAFGDLVNLAAQYANRKL